MPALRQQEHRAALVSVFRHHVEKERLTRNPLHGQRWRLAYYKLVIQPPDTFQKREERFSHRITVDKIASLTMPAKSSSFEAP